MQSHKHSRFFSQGWCFSRFGVLAGAAVDQERLNCASLWHFKETSPPPQRFNHLWVFWQLRWTIQWIWLSRSWKSTREDALLYFFCRMFLFLNSLTNFSRKNFNDLKTINLPFTCSTFLHSFISFYYLQFWNEKVFSHSDGFLAQPSERISRQQGQMVKYRGPDKEANMKCFWICELGKRLRGKSLLEFVRQLFNITVYQCKEMHEMHLVTVVRLKVGDSLVILLFKMLLKVASECNGMCFLVELLVNFIFVF